MTKLYPLTLKLVNKKVLVVGAGKVALRKLQGLLGTGAEITVVSPEVLPEIKTLPDIQIIQRPFQANDTKGMHIIYAATDKQQVNDEVGRYIEHWQWFDDTALPEASNFFTPAVIREKGLIVSISTEARDPTRAKLIKQKITDFLLKSTN
ncbi:hypothetical protein MTZ49_08555 [Entomomonas sp. E2T0]|uniref:precorrin-2 dehydrogenase/sirohydrochlorin ferrochelatase family protein n=1 Tax=Entomomonas sp. E2T0 TaxID=2930213 RepID=UPI0022282584|nr:NAD(P)-dependent oxidoreductase [Entomomonas sp. E2T0]UYZ82666.1 hypothetical protein MTZ49_08555 [Entomomonas sp. E2T0]